MSVNEYSYPNATEECNVIYIAGPMRGKEDYGEAAFDEAEFQLQHRGWTVCSPSKLARLCGFNSQTVDDRAHLNSVLLQDIALLCSCHAIFFLDGWDQSIGARMEKGVADFLRLRTFFQYLG